MLKGIIMKYVLKLPSILGSWQTRKICHVQHRTLRLEWGKQAKPGWLTGTLRRQVAANI